MKKNIIIFGSSRSGKTTLSKLLNKKFNYNIVSIDSVVSAFSRGFPQLNINHNANGDTAVNNIKPFLWEYIQTLNKSSNKKRDIFYCIEGAYFDINDVKKHKDDFIVIILVEQLDSWQKYFDKMKKYDKDYDWTKQLSDEDLKEYAKNLKRDNNRIVDFCKKNNLEFYDTSIDRETIFTQICEDVQHEINLTEDEDVKSAVIKYGEISVMVNAPKYLLEHFKKRYKEIYEVNYFQNKFDYQINFVFEMNDKRKCDICYFTIPDLDHQAHFFIDNQNRCSFILLKKEYTRDTKKRIFRNFIFTIFTRLYQLKGALLLHCACVEKDNKSLLIVGDVNSGKTSLMLALLNRGYNFITNDFLIIDKNGDNYSLLKCPKFIGIRKSQLWLQLPENSKYNTLKSEGHIRITGERIYISPQDLVLINNVKFGNSSAKVKSIIFPTYAPNSEYFEDLISHKEKEEKIKNNIFNDFVNCSNAENYENDIYKVNVQINNSTKKGEIINFILGAPAYKFIENETNYMNMINKIEKIIR